MMKYALQIVDKNPLGAGAGYGVPLSLNRELSSEVLGFSGPIENPLYAVSSRGKVEFFLLSAAASIHLDLARLSTDLIFFSGEEFGFFEIPSDFTTGSSIMPQKKNPDVLEIVRGKSSGYLGFISKIYSTLSGLISGYNRDQQEIKKPLMDGLDTTESCLEIISPLIEGLRVNEEKLYDSFEEEVLATDKVFKLVERGVPFREAYRRVKEELKDVDFGEEKEKEIKKILNARDHRGGTANLGIERLLKRLEEMKSFFDEKQESFKCSIDELTAEHKPADTPRSE